MPSDSPAGRDRLAWLRSQGLGLCCGLATVALLAIGSFVIPATRDGASAGIGMDDLRGFFDPPRFAHLWLYLLFPVAALYAVNTVLATWDTVIADPVLITSFSFPSVKMAFQVSGVGPLLSYVKNGRRSGSPPFFLTPSAHVLVSGSEAFFHKAVCSGVSGLQG